MTAQTSFVLFPDHWANPRIEAPICATPIGLECRACGYVFQAGHRGLFLPTLDAGGWSMFPWHRDCFFKSLGLPYAPEVRGECGICGQPSFDRVNGGLCEAHLEDPWWG